MRRIAALTSTALLTLALLAGCGDSDTPASSGGSSSGSSGASGSSSTAPEVIAITVDGDSVTPNGERVEVAVGQPIELDVTADAAGEIHVHSTPEQEFEYTAGDTTLQLAAITRPGIIDVESHTLDKTIVQLQVQ